METFIATGLFDLSVLLFVVVLIMSFAYHRYTIWHKLIAISYLVSCVLLLQHKAMIDSLVSMNAPYFMMAWGTTIVYALGFIIPHILRKRYIKSHLHKKLGQARLISFKQLKEQKVNNLQECRIALSKKKFIEKGKLIFESIIYPSENFTEWYYNDFTNQYRIIDGVLSVEYKTGEIEQPTRGEEVIVRPYEAHRIKAKTEPVKVLITCIDPNYRVFE